MWTFRTIILPIAYAEQARGLCMALTGSASEGMFTVPLYTGEDTEPTHTISSGYIATEFADMLDSAHEALVDLLAGAGVTVTLPELEGLLSLIDISTEEPHAAIGRLGLALAPVGLPAETVPGEVL